MNRSEMIEKAYRALHQFSACGCDPDDGDLHPMDLHMATEVVDVLLPQVTTVEELEALPFDTKVIDTNGEAWARYYLATKDPRPLRWRNSRGGYGKTSIDLARRGPLTVVWQP